MKKASLLISTLSLSIVPIVLVSSCSSVPITDLKISITKSPVTQQDIDKAIIDYNATSDIPARVIILNKLFSGVTVENFVHFTTDTTGNTITLKALPNFAFGTRPTISARVVTAAIF